MCKINPGEFLYITTGNTPNNSTITVGYFIDAGFDSAAAFTILVQNEQAQILALERLDTNPTQADAVRWEAIFDRAVAGVTAGNFQVVNHAGLNPAPTITSVLPSAGAGHTRWTVTVNTSGAGTGQVGLNWAASVVESPSSSTPLTGPTYDITDYTFIVSSSGHIFIQNFTSHAWHFNGGLAGPAIFYRVSQDRTQTDQWGSANFHQDFSSIYNRIEPGAFLRISANGTPAGQTIVLPYASNGVPSTFRILVQNGTAQVTTMHRLDPTPTTAASVRWRVTFNKPIAGVLPQNFTLLNYAGGTASIASALPDGDYSRWIVTVDTTGIGSGALVLRWSGNFGAFTFESPDVPATFTGELYDFHPLTFNVAPGGTIDIENLDAARWYFHVAPTPTTATMARVGESTIGVLPWGTSGFLETGTNSDNWIPENEWLRINANNTPVGTPIDVRAYRSVSPSDPGFNIRVNVEVPPAQVVSLNIMDPSPTEAQSVRWEATFSQAVTNVTAANFRFINSAHIEPTPTITSVAPTPGAGNVKWIITANTAGTGIGFLGLRWLGHVVESPSVPNTFTGQSYDFSEYPLITQEPSPLSAILKVGDAAPTLTVAATVRTSDTLNYQWKRGSSQFPLDAVNIPGATSPSFTPPTDDDGHYSYFCRVFTTPGYYRDSLTSVMHVYHPPAIITHPTNQIVVPGGSATFTVQTFGTELQHQWFEGVKGDRTHPVAGAIGKTFNTGTLNQNRRYWVLVSNALGAAYEKESNSALARVITIVRGEPATLSPVILSTLQNVAVRVLDSDGNSVPWVTIQWNLFSLGHIGGAAPGGNFGGALYAGGQANATSMSDANGLATAPALWTNTRAGSYTLAAFCQGVGTAVAVDFITINNQPLPPSGFVWIKQPSATATAGVPFVTQPEVQLQDVWGNLITTSGVAVTASPESGAGTLQGTITVATVSGIAAFTNLAGTVAGSMKVRMDAAGASASSDEITIAPGPPHALVVMSGSSQTAMPGANFGQPVRAKLTDAFGNPIRDRSITFTAPATGASATFPNSASAMTDNQGRAHVSVRANDISGVYSVSAQPSGVVLPNPPLFTLSNHKRLEAWRAANFGGEWRNTGNAANGATPFGDGVPNLLKFALNLNAQRPDATPMTATGTKGVPLVGMDEQGRLTLTFVRRKAATQPGIVYLIEFSDALGSGFAPNPAATESAPVSIDPTWERVTVTDSESAAVDQPHRFARLVVAES